ncbi:DNA repair protein RecO [Chlamydia sp. 17-3921]|uniref:DNA repair protein RecO n=1 Tax=Chlamydia sp. 17-3921 TaxID=2675798 RepID=UPI001919DAC9|nr:DNA repair protein RecO [Chlamydia sp. 17-3921]
MRIFSSGIVLQNQPIGKNHLLVTLFSPEGLITFFAKQGQTLLCPHRESLLPFSFGNYTLEYSPPKIRSFIYGEIHHDFPELRQTYSLLQAGGKMTQAVLSSQWKEKPSSELFSLFFNFLYRLHQSKNPELFSAIFLLKLLQYEGILDLSTSCSICKTPLIDATCYRYQGQKLCKQHAPQEAVVIDKNEEHILQAIIYAKQFEELLQLASFPITIADKIFYMFETSLQTRDQKI